MLELVALIDFVVLEFFPGSSGYPEILFFKNFVDVKGKDKYFTEMNFIK